MVFSVARNCSGWAAARPRRQHRDDGGGDERSTRRHVTYDVRDGYVASAPELRQPIVALMSLDGLRRKIEIALLPDDVRIVLQLDGLAERERHRRRAQAR